MVNTSLIEFLDFSYKKRIFFLLFVSLLFSVTDTLGLALLIPYLEIIQNSDLYLLNDYVVSVFSLFSIQLTSLNLVVFSSIFLAFFMLLRAIVNLLMSFMQASFANDLCKEVGMRLFNKYLKMNYLNFSMLNSNNLIKNCTSTLVAAMSCYLYYLQFISATITTCALFFLLLYRDFFVTCIFGLLFLCVGGLTYFFLKKRQGETGKIKDYSIGLVHKLTSEAFLSFKEVRLLGKFSYFEDKLFNALSTFAKAGKNHTFFPTIPQVVIEFSIIMLLLFTVLICTLKNFPLASLVPQVIFYVAVVKRLLPSINLALSSKLMMKGSYPLFEKLVSELENDFKEESASSNQVFFKKTLEFRGLNFSYFPEGPQILRDINITLYANESIAIVGESGGGKTTFVEIITSLLKPTAGEILIDGNRVSNLYGIRSQIGYVPQMVTLLDSTIEENIAFGEDLPDRNRLKNAVAMAHLSDFIDSLKDGLQTKIGERGMKISGGQRQRIGIARALYTNPSLLIFDEATSALDNISEKAITETIAELSGRKTMIVIAHRLSTVRSFKNIIVVHKGGIIARGDHASLLKSCKVYQELNFLDSSPNSQIDFLPERSDRALEV